MFPSFLDQFTTHGVVDTVDAIDAVNAVNIDTSNSELISCANVGTGRIDNTAILATATSSAMTVVKTGLRKKGPLYIHDKRWYFRLVPPKEGEYGRARALMQDYELNMLAQHLVVCFTPGMIPGQPKPYLNEKGEYGRLYAFFESYLEFYKYMQNFAPENRAFYEIVFGELPQKPHFDIDISADNLDKYYPHDNIDSVAELLREAVMLGCVQVLADLRVDINVAHDILLYSSHGTNKRSWHIIINNRCHDGNKEARAFYDAVLAKVRIYTGGKYMQSEFIDPGVYSPRQQFRLIGSQKPGSGRPKIFYEDFVLAGVRYKHIYNEDVSDIQMKKLTVIYESLIGFTTGCSYLPSLLPERTGNPNNLGDLPDLESSIVQQCMNMLKSKLGDCPFSIKTVQGHLIMLKRNAKSFCPICKREHQTENPYMFIIGGKVYWDCRRSETGASKLMLGYLAMSLDELMTAGYNGDTMNIIDNTIEDNSDDDTSMLMFGDYKLGESIQSISTTTDNASMEKKEVKEVKEVKDPIKEALATINVPVSERMQNIEAITRNMVKTRAEKKYMRSQPEDLLGIRSLSSIASEMAWAPGL